MRLRNHTTTATGSRFRSPAAGIVAGAGALTLVASGAYAAGEIGSRDIENDSIRSADVRDDTLQQRDLSAGTKAALLRSETQTFLTDPSTIPVFGGLPVAEVPASPKNGSDDSETPLLTFELDKGTYVIDGTAQFFHFVPGDDSEDFGLVSLLVEGSDEQGTAFTPDIPNDGNNGAQTNATSVVTIPEDDTVLTVVGTIRGERAGQAGAQVVTTKVG